MTTTLTAPVLEVAHPAARTTFAQPDYDAGDFVQGDRIKWANDTFDKIAVGDEGTVIRVDEGDIYPLIVWLDKWGPQTSIEAVARMGLPTCAGDLAHV